MSVDLVQVEVGQEVAFYGKYDNLPQKKTITKVYKSGRFLIEGVEEQFTPKRFYNAISPWGAVKSSPHSRYSIRVYPWGQYFIDEVEAEKNMRLRQRQIAAIKNEIQNLHYRSEAKIERLLEALGLQFDIK